MTPAKTGGQRAQTMSKSKAVEAMTESQADVMTAQRRVDTLQADLQQAQNVRDEAQARLNDAKNHLERAIAKEVGA